MIDMRGADLALLVSLDVLLEEANVTRAASRLNISQPALSAQLARLRDLLGDPLLLPSETGRGMVATERARQLRAPLREALLGLEKPCASRPYLIRPARSALSPWRPMTMPPRYWG